jgi:hypothetical protein
MPQYFLEAMAAMARAAQIEIQFSKQFQYRL